MILKVVKGLQYLHLILPLIEFYFELNFAVLCHSTKLRNGHRLDKSGVLWYNIQGFKPKSAENYSKIEKNNAERPVKSREAAKIAAS